MLVLFRREKISNIKTLYIVRSSFFFLRNEGVSLPVTIGNIPHKIAFQTFDDKDEFLKLPETWTKKYPSLPAHTGNKYISYKMK